MSNPQNIEYESLGLSKIFLDYISGNEKLSARFPGPPFAPDSVQSVTAALKSRDYPRQELVNRLVDYNQELGAGEATLRNIDTLKKPNSFVVCTGQQPSVLTGPVFNVYKAISCLTLARTLTAASEENTFVPVFWCASEDHDLEEMNHLFLPGRDGDIRKLRVDLTNDGRPAEAVRVGRSIRRVLKDAMQLLPDTEFKDEVSALFEPAPEDTLGTWFNRILIALFSDDGLVVLEPRLIRDLAAPVLQKELDTPNETSGHLKRAGEALSALGYEPSFDGSPKVHCFYIGGRRRARIKFYADFCILGEDRVDRREMSFHLEEHPERFSPDASLRPIVQSAVLPVSAYVAGPGEVAYFAQLKELHGHFDVPMPVIYPRASVTLVEGSVMRAMEKFGLSPSQLFMDAKSQEELLESTAKGTGLPASLDSLIEQSIKLLDSLVSDVSEFDEGISRMVQKARGRIGRELDHLKRRVTGAIDEAAGVGRRRLARLFSSTYPNSVPQERVFNILYYLAKYGPDLPRSLIQSLRGETRQHFVFMLEAYDSLASGTPEQEEEDSSGAEPTVVDEEGGEGPEEEADRES